MRGLRVTLGGIVAAATLAGVVFVGAATAAAAAPSGVVRSALEGGRAAVPAFSAPGPATLDNLYGVSCVSGSFCMAVGEGAAAGAPLAEAWNGSTWRVVKAPPGGADLSAVSCAAASFCVGVPGTTVSNVAEEWNGRAWHLMNMSGDSCGPFFCLLYGVSCPRPQDCMAVGTYTNHAGTVVLGKALKWNGRTWRDTIPPSLAQNAGLAMVSCPSASSCLAAGQNAIAWDGSSWRQLAAPAALWVRGLSCPRPRSCMLVGGQGYGSSPASAQAWAGSTWRRLRPAQPGKSARVLFSVSCWRRLTCMAVGSYSTMPISPSGDALTLAEQWNGTTWRVRSTPSP